MTLTLTELLSYLQLGDMNQYDMGVLNKDVVELIALTARSR